MTISDYCAIPALFLSLFALYQIERNKVEFLRSEIVSCASESLLLFRNLFVILDAVSNNVIYRELPDKKVVETAVDRYWKRINDLAKEWNALVMKQKIVFPGELYKISESIIRDFNNARILVRDGRQEDLKKLLKECRPKTGRFVTIARQYVGADMLDKLDDQSLADTDQEK